MCLTNRSRSWVIKARDNGYDDLVDVRGHHKDKSGFTELDKAKLRIRQLEAELKDKGLVRRSQKNARTPVQGVIKKHRRAYQAIKEVSQGHHWRQPASLSSRLKATGNVVGNKGQATQETDALLV